MTWTGDTGVLATLISGIDGMAHARRVHFIQNARSISSSFILLKAKILPLLLDGVHFIIRPFLTVEQFDQHQKCHIFQAVKC